MHEEGLTSKSIIFELFRNSGVHNKIMSSNIPHVACTSLTSLECFIEIFAALKREKQNACVFAYPTRS
jgi:hypothetical protein